MSRRGLSLLEVLIALTITSVVALLVWSVLQAAAFRLRERSERIGLEHSLRVAWAATRSMLESLGQDSAAGPDLALAAPDGVAARAVRGSGVLCGAGPDTLLARNGSGWWTELRGAVPGRDSLLVGAVIGPDHWTAVSLYAAPLPGVCPDGSPALRLPARLAPADLAAVGAGSPLRVFEPVELRAYSSAGAWWLGMRGLSSAGPIQPLAGPFAGSGVRFTYYSRAGIVVSVAGSVAQATVDLSGLTERLGGLGVARVARVRSDSAADSILLRNAP